jgi:hypothetical protein
VGRASPSLSARRSAGSAQRFAALLRPFDGPVMLLDGAVGLAASRKLAPGVFL